MSECLKEKVCCAGCGLEHAASYGGCIKAKTAKDMQKIRASQKVTYSEAVQINRRGWVEQIQEREESQRRGEKEVTSIGTQTLEINESAVQTKNREIQQNTEEKLSLFIIK